MHTIPREPVDEAIDRLTRDAGRLEPRHDLADDRGEHPVRRILAGIEEGASSATAVDWAAAIAQPVGARVHVLHAVENPDAVEHYLDFLASYAVPGPSTLLKDLETRGQALVDEAVARLRKRDVEASGSLAYGPPVRALVDSARSTGADLVVLGSRGRGSLGRALLGSVADAVLNHVEASVLIARTEPPPRSLLLATDGSRASKRAAALGLALGRAWKASASLLHVVRPLEPDFRPDKIRRRAFGDLDLRWNDPRTTAELAFGNPATVIVQEADGSHHGLIVMGSRGLSGLRSLAAGSVSRRVAHEAHASVLLVKEGRPVVASARETQAGSMEGSP